MNEMTLSSLIQIMQDGFIQHDKQEGSCPRRHKASRVKKRYNILGKR